MLSAHGRTKMAHNSLRTVIIGASMTIGCLGAAYAAPIAPAAMTALSSPSTELVSYWGRAYPWGYIPYHGQCYSYVQVQTDTGYAWQRVWICNGKNRGGPYGHGYVAHFWPRREGDNDRSYGSVISQSSQFDRRVPSWSSWAGTPWRGDEELGLFTAVGNCGLGLVHWPIPRCKWPRSQ